MHADDLGRYGRRQVHRLIDADCATVACDQFLVMAYDIDDIAIDQNPAGLGGSVWSADVEKAKRYARQLECGSVWINKHGTIQPNAPFGGVKQSGIGVEFGAEGLKEFTTIQTVLS